MQISRGRRIFSKPPAPARNLVKRNREDQERTGNEAGEETRARSFGTHGDGNLNTLE